MTLTIPTNNGFSATSRNERPACKSEWIKASFLLRSRPRPLLKNPSNKIVHRKYIILLGIIKTIPNKDSLNNS
jgi:hypothetical protein